MMADLHSAEPGKRIRGRWPKRHEVALAAALMLAPFLSCDESLPPPEDPFAVLKAEVNMLSLQGIVNVRDGVPLGGAGVISLAMTNVHDEVLDDSAAIEIDLDVWLKSNPAVRAHLRFDEAYLTTSGALAGGILTMRPNSPVAFYYPWSHRASDGTTFWDHLRLTQRYTREGVPFCESDTVTLSAIGEVRLFPRIAPAPFPERDFKIVYRIYNVLCPPVLE